MDILLTNKNLIDSAAILFLYIFGWVILTLSFILSYSRGGHQDDEWMYSLVENPFLIELSPHWQIAIVLLPDVNL